MSITSDLMYRLLVQGVSDYAIYMVGRDGTVLNWNAGAERAKGYAASDIVGRNFEVFYSADDRASGVPKQNLDNAARMGRVSLEGWRYRRDGSAFWASITIDAISDADGSFLGFAKITRDLTEQHELMVRIEHQANHDGLTGLLNRSGLFKRLEEEMASERSFSIYCLDLDHFKPINDRLGHAAGDIVLQETGRRLLTLMRGRGLAGRLGGDEFVAAQLQSSNKDEFQSFCQRIGRELSLPVLAEGELVSIGVSIGTARFPEDGRDIGIILRKADVDLYKSKNDKRNEVLAQGRTGLP